MRGSSLLEYGPALPFLIRSSFAGMVSHRDTCKRALVSLLRILATLYGCCVGVTRESLDCDVRKAYRTVSKKVHPDKGGNAED